MWDLIKSIAIGRIEYVKMTSTYRCAICSRRGTHGKTIIEFLRTFAYEHNDQDIVPYVACSDHFDDWVDTILASKFILFLDGIKSVEITDDLLIKKYNKVVISLLKTMIKTSKSFLRDICTELRNDLQSERTSITEYTRSVASTHRPITPSQFEITPNASQYECTVCWRNLPQLIISGCGHSLCDECFDKLKPDLQCPYCRTKITMTTCKRYIDPIVIIDD